MADPKRSPSDDAFLRWWFDEKIPVPAGVGQSRILHDRWSAHIYGGTLKVVYHKAERRLTEGERERRTVHAAAATERPDGERFAQSVSRSKARIFELAACNEFTTFCTFTQDERLRNRFDLSAFRKDLAQFVRNQNRGRSEAERIRYLMIPEEHKRGGWHMHGLFMGLVPGKDLRPFALGERIPERIKRTIRDGVAVYDWTAYRRAFGFFTCTEIADNGACARYVTKYISKDLQKGVREAGEHLFFASQGLKGRQTIADHLPTRCPVEKWDFENEYVAVREMPLDDPEAAKVADAICRGFNEQFTNFGK